MRVPGLHKDYKKLLEKHGGDFVVEHAGKHFRIACKQGGGSIFVPVTGSDSRRGRKNFESDLKRLVSLVNMKSGYQGE